MAAAAVERLGHGAVGRLDVHALTKAPVHLDPVNAPARVAVRVLRPEAHASDAAADARLRAAARVEAEAEALAVHVVDDGLHAVAAARGGGEVRAGQRAARVASAKRGPPRFAHGKWSSSA